MNSGEIGRTITTLREEKGFSQKELAELIPINQSNLSRWENGLIIPSVQQLERTCEVLGVSLELFISQNKDEYEKEYNRLKKKNLNLKILLAVAVIIMAAGILTISLPKYRIIGEAEKYQGYYGDTLRIYAEPIFFLTENGAYRYGEEVAKKYEGSIDLSVIEIIFVKNNDITNEENELYSGIYFLNNLSE